MLEDIPAPGSSGQVIKSDGTNWTSGADAGLPAAGADGQLLTSDGTNWASEAAAAGGAWAVKGSGSVAGFNETSALLITSITKTIKVYLSFIPSNNTQLWMKTSTDGGTNWGGAPHYDIATITGQQGSGTLTYHRQNNAGGFPLDGGASSTMGNNTGVNVVAEVTLHTPESNRAKIATWDVTFPTSVGQDDNYFHTVIGKGVWGGSTAINAVKFYPAAGTFSAGTYIALELN